MVFHSKGLQINPVDTDFSQVPVLNIKGADVAYLWSRYEKLFVEKAEP